MDKFSNTYFDTDSNHACTDTFGSATQEISFQKKLISKELRPVDWINPKKYFSGKGMYYSIAAKDFELKRFKVYPSVDAAIADNFSALAMQNQIYVNLPSE